MLTKMAVYLVPVDLHARSTISLADFDIAKPRDPRPNAGAHAPPLNGFATRRQRQGFPHCNPLPQTYYSFLEGQNAPKGQTQAQTRASLLNGGTYVHGDSIHRP